MNLDISSLTEWITKFKRLNGIQRTELLTAVGKQVGAAAESVVSPYPEASGKPLTVWYSRTNSKGQQYKSKFKSARQQGYVMALVARGKVPYRRTGTLGKSITSKVRFANANGVDVMIGSNLNYAPYVLDEGQQSNYHKGTWHTLQQDLTEGQLQILQTAKSAFTTEVNRRLNSG